MLFPEVQPPQASTVSHGGQAIHVLCLRPVLFPKVGSPPAPKDSHWRKALFVPGVWAGLCAKVKPPSTPSESLRRKTVFMLGVREVFRKETGSCFPSDKACKIDRWQFIKPCEVQCATS
ncbi:unnamed protein product [Staurois parvus]|uniref:Uncharacterized protein n=1 Tax=Staurois parvus TaxID=386267 RepID=A0ABN9BTD3_9NEOB|nr:unnamed protein product [Staurois parvus]